MNAIQTRDCGFWLIHVDQDIYFPDNNLPFGTAESLNLTHRHAARIGEWDGHPLFVVEEDPAEQREWTALRALLRLSEEKFYLLNRGVELNYFLKTHRRCGKCGHKTEMASDEWAVQCQACGYRSYPVICPSIIVAVRKGKEILLAHHIRHIPKNGGTGMYTTLAGFVEIGESFEQTVEREVFEETGLKVKNIRYFGSQPWAFPNSQMVGFLADYDSGEIRLQKEELHDARWFHCDQPLPELPPEGTIALKLIHATLNICRRAEIKE